MNEYLTHLEIIDKEYITEDGKKIPQTAELSFVKNSGITEVQTFGYYSQDDLFKMIDNNEPINLDECYVADFSLSYYRKERKMDKEAPVILNGFSAKKTFFKAEKNTDFSFARIINECIDFSYSRFSGGNIVFHGAIFDQGNVLFNYVFFENGNVDFSNTHFVTGEVDFKNAVFRQGKKDFQYSEFGKGNKSFVNAEFSDGNVSFVNTLFNDGEVSFKIARFGKGNVDFHYARFGNGEKIFERTNFGDGSVDFRKMEIGTGRVNFNRASFGYTDIDFEGSEIINSRFNFKRAQFTKGNLSFMLVQFINSQLYFDNTTFGEGDILFGNSIITNISFKNCHLNHYLDLRAEKIDYVDLSNTIVRDIIDLKPGQNDVHIQTINFTGMRLLGRIFISWKDNNVKSLIKSQLDSTTAQNKADQFRTLKENFNITGQYQDEDYAYVEFKRYEAKDNLITARKSKNFWRIITEYPKFFIRWLVFDQIGLYATSPVRVLTSMLFIYILFSILYVFLPVFSNAKIVSSLGDPDKLGVVAVAFYHSVVTFLTIGYGDYYPSGAVRWISGIEGFLGLFLMSYFTVAFVRKILR